ncbi:hypothetical protein F4861DRAFT_376513 [Xylaria intraflava]|nr:hypothetical protein F4861DRAFT_376513 [Xylaria intraflava]
MAKESSTSTTCRPRFQRVPSRFGYSSASESEEPPCKASPANNGNNNQKKKKKRKLSPQQTINGIWRRFATQKYSKALSVMPFDPVPLPSTLEEPNELLSVGYERAREECSRRVKKIIQECKRVNTRYRDPNFDLDWDLKMGRGNCLNYLGSSGFDMANTRYSTTNSVPKAVKRVHEIFEKPTFLKDIDGTDIKQGGVGDCWFIASLSALAGAEDRIKRICVEYDTRIGIYGFVFYRDGEWIYSIIDDKLYLTSPNWDSPSMQRDLMTQIDRESPEKDYRKTYQTGSKALFFAQCKNQNETWAALVEKAYAKAHGDFGSLSGGWIGEGLEDLTGGVTTELLASDILDLDAFWENEVSKVNQEFLFGCSTGLIDGGYGDRNGIREGHAYVIMDARTLKSGERLVKLRNPWGKIRKGVWEGPWSDGSKEWNQDVMEELGHQFGNDSVFWIRFEDMVEKYLHFDRTRLFRDPDWQCSQRSIGVEVPWKPQWNEKFHFKLTKESPLVLVLHQLDNRYYRGLRGQYSFRLHFRVHEQDRPDSEDYIVRSHGNYLMSRSVTVEIPSMEPGNYSVFLSIVGERDTELPSVEDIVKRECRNREENEKFAQVGYAYDLAHSKGVAHLEHVAELRKKSDRKKASTSRIEQRRKMWEMRHLDREIARLQIRKNRAKRDRIREAEDARKKARQEAEAAERKKLEEEEAAERKKKEDQQESKDVAVQTDAPIGSEDKGSQTVSDEPDSPSNQPDALTSEKSNSTKATDQSREEKEAKSSSSGDSSARQARRSGAAEDRAPRPPPGEDSECDTSDSPVEEWELLYSSDEISKKPKRMATPAPATNANEAVETDGESELPDPWNAICIVGFRVYSKDPDLDLRVVIEGGDLTEGGRGEKGAADIDDAQMNAGGERSQKREQNKTVEKFEIVDGIPVVQQKETVVDEKTNDENATDEQNKILVDDGNIADTEGDDDGNDDDGEEEDSHSVKSDITDSTESTPINTPDSTTECSPQSR